MSSKLKIGIPIECRDGQTRKPFLVGLGTSRVGVRMRTPIECRNMSRPTPQLRKSIFKEIWDYVDRWFRTNTSIKCRNGSRPMSWRLKSVSKKN